MSDYLSLAQEVFEGKLDLVCPRMELRICPNYDEVVLEGSGVIRSDDEGRLYFRMAAPFVGKPSPALERHRPPGEMYEIDDHVQLRAVDHHGREWRAGPLLVHLVFPFNLQWNVRQFLPSMITFPEAREQAESRIRMYMPLQARLPFDLGTHTTHRVGDEEVGWSKSWNRHRRQIGDANVEFLLRDRHWLVVDAQQAAPLGPDWPNHLRQALALATASVVRPVVLTRTVGAIEHVGVFSGPFREARLHMPPPFVGDRTDQADHFWHLVQRVCEFLSRSDVAPLVHDELDGIRSGAAGSIQTACLTLAVGIESLAGALLPDPPVDPDNRAAVDELIRHVRAWSGDERLRGRAAGMLGSMKATRAADRMYAWARSSHCPDMLIQEWKRLRDRKAHGNSPEEDQKLFDRYYAAVELLHRLVASVAGYERSVASSSTRGWGVADRTNEPLD